MNFSACFERFIGIFVLPGNRITFNGLCLWLKMYTFRELERVKPIVTSGLLNGPAFGRSVV